MVLKNEKLQIFISHSEKDKKIAERLVTLIQSAFKLPVAAIRCTSVDGYMLPIGIPIEQRLQHEIFDARVFIALLTLNSLRSPWVLMELGARWGAKKQVFPLLYDVDPRDAQMGPLAVFNSLNCRDEARLYQFIEELGKTLARKPDSASIYRKCILDLAESPPLASAVWPAARNIFQEGSAPSEKPGALPAHGTIVIRGEIYSSPKWGSAWILLDSPLDFFRGDRLRITLGGLGKANEPPAGKVLVRLLENGNDPNGPTGIITPAGISVPLNRTFEITIPANFQNVVHISIHGGTKAWNYFLGEGNGPATLVRVELITAADSAALS
jgi:hypothetical protein